MAYNKRTLADPAMLAKIDQLFACNVGSYIPLPQIVVVGDQSSGKSSVLEGLTQLPFPRDSGLCTRFATQITFRRSSTTSISISIIPGDDADENHVDTVCAFRKDNITSLDPETFAEVMKEVHNVMGIEPPKTFSSDVLSVEITGPEQDHLTVIDVPGIFQRTTKDVTTKADIDFVKAMVFAYMKNPRSIMLAVVPANVDVATQLILEMAEEVDNEGQRTLGVLTKLDLVDKGAEKHVEDMVLGHAHALSLGWSVVKNPGQQDLGNPDFDRYEDEATFFSTVAPWDSIPKARVGVEALRHRLQDILANHIRREFPKVKDELLKKLEQVKHQLESMGPKRDTPAEQMRFLIEVSMRYRSIVEQAIHGRYNYEWFNNPNLRVANRAVRRDEIFSDDFERFGHTYRWESRKDGTKPASGSNVFRAPGNQTLQTKTPTMASAPFTFGGSSASTGPQMSNTSVSPGSAQVPTSKSVFDQDFLSGRNVCETRKLRCTDLAILDLMHPSRTLTMPEEGLIRWIDEVFNRFHAYEVGNYDPALLSTIFERQAQRWDSLAFGYISDIATIASDFLKDLLEEVCPDKEVCARIDAILVDKVRPLYERAFQQVRFIMEVEHSNMPHTVNHYFNDSVQKEKNRRQHRLQDAIASKSLFDDPSRPTISLESLSQIQEHMNNNEHVIRNIHDILKSYHKSTRKSLVDTIVRQAAMHLLITGPVTPLQVFSPNLVASMSEEQLDRICGEDQLTKKRRSQLVQELKGLEQGREILF